MGYWLGLHWFDKVILENCDFFTIMGLCVFEEILFSNFTTVTTVPRKLVCLGRSQICLFGSVADLSVWVGHRLVCLGWLQIVTQFCAGELQWRWQCSVSVVSDTWLFCTWIEHPQVASEHLKCDYPRKASLQIIFECNIKACRPNIKARRPESSRPEYWSG